MAPNPTAAITPHVTRRCAIYTRKSSEEGLEQDFNSLDAQREACAAYILSQQHEGWVGLSQVYDDGGKSGATLERPALQRLLSDITRHRIDVLVVYKVDRLTRSLADFAKLVEVFDAHKVSFVSITQHFNTTTSMGRLTLNVLLSFAQFEREVTAEHIRDKIAASKRKGLWMGGNPPLGYDVQDRQLVINEADAATVRIAFQRYLILKSVADLKTDLDARGIVSKRYPNGRGGTPMQRGALYRLLSNPIYRGQVQHKGNCYPGQHPAMIDDDLWSDVQAQLKAGRDDRSLQPRAAHPSLLTGRLYDGAGHRLTPTHAVKQGRRYRYYISQPLTVGKPRNTTLGLRLPAAEIEKLVSQRLRQCLLDRPWLYDVLNTAEVSAAALEAQLARLALLSSEWDALPTARKRALVLTVLQRVTLTLDSITLVIDPQGIAALATNQPLDLSTSSPSKPSAVTLTFPARLCQTRGGLRLILEGIRDDAPQPDLKILKLLKTAHAYKALVMQADENTTLEQLAAQAHVSPSYFTRILRLAWLAPDITRALIEGRHPPDLNPLKLNQYALDLSTEWKAQRQQLGVTHG